MKPEQLGVFHIGGAWRLFHDTGESRAFATRREAVLSGEALAAQVHAAGRAVELYVEENSGDLQAVDLKALANAGKRDPERPVNSPTPRI